MVTSQNLVSDVTPKGASAGLLQPGDQIVAVDGRPLVGLSVHDVIAPSPTHTFRVRRTPSGSPAKRFAGAAPIA